MWPHSITYNIDSKYKTKHWDTALSFHQCDNILSTITCFPKQQTLLHYMRMIETLDVASFIIFTRQFFQEGVFRALHIFPSLLLTMSQLDVNDVNQILNGFINDKTMYFLFILSIVYKNKCLPVVCVCVCVCFVHFVQSASVKQKATGLSESVLGALEKLTSHQSHPKTYNATKCDLPLPPIHTSTTTTSSGYPLITPVHADTITKSPTMTRPCGRRPPPTRSQPFLHHAAPRSS